eukprot:scaffold22754_cov68-Phaeocystis_antarctica.AAC.2
MPGEALGRVGRNPIVQACASDGDSEHFGLVRPPARRAAPLAGGAVSSSLRSQPSARPAACPRHEAAIASQGGRGAAFGATQGGARGMGFAEMTVDSAQVSRAWRSVGRGRGVW